MAEILWKEVTRVLAGLRLGWFIRALHENEIPHREIGFGLVGPIVKVPDSEIFRATMILTTPIGAISVSSDSDITIMDLPNDHPFFQIALGNTPATAQLPSKENSAIKELPFVETNIPNMLEPVRLYDVKSSNASAIAYYKSNTEAFDKAGIHRECLIVQFKGGALYRYYATQEANLDSVFAKLLKEAVAVEGGNQEASVGSMIHHLIKVPADEGKIVCDKFDSAKSSWVNVPKKSERVKQMKKPTLSLPDDF